MQTLNLPPHEFAALASNFLKQENIFPKLGIYFIHIPKTAGTSIHHFFNELENKIEMPHKRAQELEIFQKYYRLIIRSKHLRSQQVETLLGENLYRNIYTFSFVRNPWDLMVSSYYWWIEKAPFHRGLKIEASKVSRLTFEEFIFSEHSHYKINKFIGNMESWYLNNNKKQNVNYIGKVENIEGDLKKICTHLGVNTSKIPTIQHLNKTNRTGYRDYYSSKTKEEVAERFSGTIARFGYHF
ncbi:MAG: sulfotransferase family 2 domain-containing protein [Alphaproteobacteria bacterium]